MTPMLNTSEEDAGGGQVPEIDTQSIQIDPETVDALPDVAHNDNLGVGTNNSIFLTFIYKIT